MGAGEAMAFTTANQGVIFLKVKGAIDIQSEQAATLHDYNQSKFYHNIKIRFGLNRHRMGTRIDKFFIIARLKAKSECLLGESNPRPCAPQCVLVIYQIVFRCHC